MITKDTKRGTIPSVAPTIGNISDLNAIFLTIPALLDTEVVADIMPSLIASHGPYPLRSQIVNVKGPPRPGIRLGKTKVNTNVKSPINMSGDKIAQIIPNLEPTNRSTSASLKRLLNMLKSRVSNFREIIISASVES
jgi:hypothetical protein